MRKNSRKWISLLKILLGLAYRGRSANPRLPRSTARAAFQVLSLALLASPPQVLPPPPDSSTSLPPLSPVLQAKWLMSQLKSQQIALQFTPSLGLAETPRKRTLATSLHLLSAPAHRKFFHSLYLNLQIVHNWFSPLPSTWPLPTIWAVKPGEKEQNNFYFIHPRPLKTFHSQIKSPFLHVLQTFKYLLC